jgi:hypothetical protein
MVTAGLVNLCCTVGMIWQLTSFLLMLNLVHGDTRRLVNQVWAWLKWPTLAAFVMLPILFMPLNFWGFLGSSWNFVCWWFYKDAGDDDDWKRLLKRFAGRVQQLGAKLVIVAEPATA